MLLRLEKLCQFVTQGFLTHLILAENCIIMLSRKRSHYYNQQIPLNKLEIQCLEIVTFLRQHRSDIVQKNPLAFFP